MRRRVEIRETVIAPGTIVRLKKEAAQRLSQLLARWEVLVVDGEFASVRDVEDEEDVRTFELSQLERTVGGESVVVGHEYVEELYIESEDGLIDVSFEDDLYDADGEANLPSLFDDPIRLQLEEDEEDEDA